MKHFSLVLVALCSIALLSTACGDKRLKGYEKSDSGFYYKYATKNAEGKQAQPGDFVFITLSYSSTNDSLPKFENQEMMDVFGGAPFSDDLQGVYAMLKEGEEADFIFLADSFFKGDMKPPFLKEDDLLYFKVKINKVKTLEDFEQEEIASIANYIKDNNVTVEPTQSGLYYIETVVGKGKKVEMGKKVTLHYDGKFLDGTVFDSSVQRGQPFMFTLGQDSMIPGFVEGVLLMNEGGKATLLLPSSIAYGISRPGAPIPPFAPISFDIEIISVE